MNSSKFSFGDLLEDIVSGFSGIVMAVTFYATGCTHYGLSSRKLKEDGTLGDWEWFDESRLTCKKKDAVKFEVTEKIASSGPQPNAPMM